MRLGNFDFELPVFLAPMAGVTDKAFRETVRSVGGRHVWTEMISDKALTYLNSRTLEMLDLSGEDSPRIVQLFGSEPEVMAKAATLAVARDADIIDINMGCPTLKIVKNGEGSALLRDLPLAERIAAAVVKAVEVPVTVKMRLGWTEDEIIAPELAKRMESVGVQMVSVHGRTREQFYSGTANRDWIRKVKEGVKIPVIANGDIFSVQDAQKILRETGCDGVMVGRGALGNPWLIPQIDQFLNQGILREEPSLEEKIRVASEHFERVLKYKGERVGLNEMRKHAVWYIKGIRNAALLRDQIMQTKTSGAMKDLFQRILKENV
ncbi:tRNA-U20-dihydrouridine synthase [Desulfitobacterium dichloroeliminans LMG P-21439]|uniref:tRNA-dihydrouridine synthase n=1 Tax=Desulfitobacterium dichloroeliminans (strain LMG P-21439 / DCA1) TaxID=871963 RepID=L0F4S3_DESDL|nr:tRNA dihydrouridine synthase DusB [Desulfitobacterium dichloroeliminans]AGA67666.1 tRNA-U20-dihydrouridine synthase [Desulfitobacterium dichloroeliminans LMG P-21439]